MAAVCGHIDEHRVTHDITGGVHFRPRRLQVLVDADFALLAQLDSGFFKPEPARICAPTGCDQELLALERLGASVCRRLHRIPALATVDPTDRESRSHLEPFLAHIIGEGRADLRILGGGECVHRFKPSDTPSPAPRDPPPFAPPPPPPPPAHQRAPPPLP